MRPTQILLDDVDARVFDVGDAGFRALAGAFLARDAFLQPDAMNVAVAFPTLECFVDDGIGVGRWTEETENVDVQFNFDQAPHHFDAGNG